VWVFALAVTGQGLAMFLGGILEKRIGTRLATLIGGLTTRLQSTSVSAADNILYLAFSQIITNRHLCFLFLYFNFSGYEISSFVLILFIVTAVPISLFSV